MTTDRILLAATRLGAAIGAIALVAIVATLLEGAWPFLRDIGILPLWLDGQWLPLGDPSRWGLAPILVGSAVLGLLTLAWVVPVGTLLALWILVRDGSSSGRWANGGISLLTGVPSVVLGLWGLVVLVPQLGAFHPPGASLVAGVLVLGLMILPTYTLLALDSMRSSMRKDGVAVLALGLDTIALWRLSLWPEGRRAFGRAASLSLGRAFGETMVVLMVCGNAIRMPDSLWSPIRTLTSHVALEMAYAEGLHRSSLFVAGLATMALSLVVALPIVWGRSRSRA